MKKFTSPLILSVMIMLVLSSCGFGASTTPTEVSPLVIQPTQSLAQAAIIELTVQPDAASLTSVGQVIKYNFTIKNIGTAPALGPALVTGAAAICPELSTIGNLDASLDLSEILTCTSSYTTVQADLDRGSVTMISTASLNGINSNPVTTTLSASQPKVLALTVSANPSNYSQAGQNITFTYVITNGGSGNLGPGPFTVSGGYIGATPLNCGDANTNLAAGQTVSCTSVYAITQNDLAVNTLTNQVTASGGGANPSQPASVTINKGTAAQPTPSGSSQHTVIAGEWVWQIARCYGVDPRKLAADNITKIPTPAMIPPGTILTVNNPGGYSKYYGPPCISFADHTLLAGDTWTILGQKYSADPTILQMANPNTNLTLTGTIVKLKIPNYSVGSVTTAPAQTKVLTLTVTANPVTYDQAGQTISFTYLIKNSGTAILGPGQFTVSGGYIGTTPLNCGAANTSLAPSQTVTCTSSYAITQNDLAANTLTNQVTASGGGATPSQAASVTINKATKVLTLTVSANPTTYNQAGQIITFTYVVKNSGTGNVGPGPFTVSGGYIGATPLNCGDANTNLTPGLTVTCTSAYTITQPDLAASTLTNQVTAAGGGAGPSQPASATINKQ